MASVIKMDDRAAAPSTVAAVSSRASRRQRRRLSTRRGRRRTNRCLVASLLKLLPPSCSSLLRRRAQHVVERFPLGRAAAKAGSDLELAEALEHARIIARIQRNVAHGLGQIMAVSQIEFDELLDFRPLGRLAIDVDK